MRHNHDAAVNECSCGVPHWLVRDRLVDGRKVGYIVESPFIFRWHESSPRGTGWVENEGNWYWSEYDPRKPSPSRKFWKERLQPLGLWSTGP